MKQPRWIPLLAVGGLILAACAQPAPAPTTPDPVEQPTCEPCPTEEPPLLGCSAETMSAAETERVRGWVLYQVKNPDQAAASLADLLTAGGDTWIIVRTDVVAGEFNLVIPVDAIDVGGFQAAQDQLSAVLGEPASVLCVTSHSPWPPHGSHTFITPGELEGFFLEEYDPPGRHPQSPGANPWG